IVGGGAEGFPEDDVYLEMKWGVLGYRHQNLEGESSDTPVGDLVFRIKQSVHPRVSLIAGARYVMDYADLQDSTLFLRPGLEVYLNRRFSVCVSSDLFFREYGGTLENAFFGCDLIMTFGR